VFRCLVLVVVLSTSALAASVEGKVVGVIDGDTIDVLDAAKKQHRVRFDGIDAPERGQPFSNRAKSTLSDLVFGKTVRVESDGEDKYKRLVGRVYVDGRDVGLAMLEAGMAWHYTKYDQSKKYAEGEASARSLQRGLWNDRNAIPPWVWRKMPKAERKPLQQAITPETK
jgi:endonuclease YncB( thermonuclease family)